jgi:hypothetical protein
MQARITKFKMKAESAAAARTLMTELKDEILTLPGMLHFVAVMNPDGSGHTISLIEDAAGSSAESVDRVRAIWHKFHDHVETMPMPEIYDVIADWRG